MYQGTLLYLTGQTGPSVGSWYDLPTNGSDRVMAQVSLQLGAASVILEGRLSSDDLPVYIGTFPRSGAKLVPKFPQMRARLESATSATVRVAVNAKATKLATVTTPPGDGGAVDSVDTTSTGGTPTPPPPVTPAGVTIAPSSSTCTDTGTVAFSAVVVGSDGLPMGSGAYILDYTSDAPSVLTVDQASGLAHGQAPGLAHVTVTVRGTSITSAATVTVYTPPVGGGTGGTVDPWTISYSTTVPGGAPRFTLPTGLAYDAATDSVVGHATDVSAIDTTGYTVVDLADSGTPSTNGTNLQAAVAAAAARTGGTLIRLVGGVEYRMQGDALHLPARVSGATGWVVLSADAAVTLPARGSRITLAASGSLPKITATQAGSAGAITTDGGTDAHHYAFLGLYVTPATYSGAPTVYTNLVTLGDASAAATVAAQPHHYRFERCVIQADDTFDVRRCIGLNANNVAVLDSYLECRSASEGQAIQGNNGTQQIALLNNLISACGENVMIGGGDPHDVTLLPGDLEFRRNYFLKPTRWRTGGTAPSQCKNILELKLGKRVFIEGNVFENSWSNAQAGFGMVWWSVNQDGGASYSETSNITARYNWIKGAHHAFQLSGFQYGTPAVNMNRVQISHWLVTGLGESEVGGSAGGMLMQTNKRIDDLVLEHVTAQRVLYWINSFADDPPAAGVPADPTVRSARFKYLNTIVDYNDANFRTGVSNDSLENIASMYDTGADAPVLQGNIVPGVNTHSSLGAGNLTRPADASGIGFNAYGSSITDPAQLALATTSAYKGQGTDATDPGCNIPRLLAAIAGVV